jgi:hypothetical protein
MSEIKQVVLNLTDDQLRALDYALRGSGNAINPHVAAEFIRARI